jgi:hypothetical protein
VIERKTERGRAYQRSDKMRKDYCFQESKFLEGKREKVKLVFVLFCFKQRRGRIRSIMMKRNSRF